MKSTLVSIICPFRNTEKYLPEMLDSILAQSNSKWELCIVNDHSSDASEEVVKEYAKLDQRIKLFSNTGKGIIDALQTGYSQCSGQFITRMDSDDIMSTDKLEQMVLDLNTNGQGHVALGQVKYFCEGQIGEGFKKYENWLNHLIQTGKNFSDIYKECVIASPCWMVYQSDFEKCGGFTSNTYPEDYDLVFRFFEGGLKCIPSDKVLHHWRDYSTRASRIDPNYADNTFVDLKLNYFLKLHKDYSKPLVVWGAGGKGKRIAKELLLQEIPFNWVCDNPKKIGKDIYGKKMLAFQAIDQFENAQNIITVANAKAQIDIKSFFEVRGKKAMIDFFFFC
ncbi:MAG: glycosyltransferase involved in cell wall biosynthesis [Salibacteraceae bacterium]|jgi:glycosyltransferase involved in cell wall biosynthesis